MSSNQITPKGALLVSTAVVLLASLFAWGQSSSPSITAAEQPSRDTRTQILEAELNDEQSALTEAIKRRAERLSANDAHGASEAEAAIAQHQQNIEALRRELSAAQVSSRSTLSGTPKANSEPARTADAVTNPAPWWDVYRKRRSVADPQER